MSPMPQCSAILPFSIRNMSHDVNRSFRPVGGTPSKVPPWVPSQTKLAPTLSGAVTIVSMLTRRSGIPATRALKRATTPCLGDMPGGGGAAALSWWLTKSSAYSAAKASMSWALKLDTQRSARARASPHRRAALGEKECKRRRERTALARAEVLSPILKAGEIDGDPGRVWWRDRCRPRL